jgi:DNA polymerase III epsilon subunit-like protein
MQHSDWVLIDTETNGLTAPIIVVDLAAQRMRGWELDGPAFRRLLNQNSDIAPEASRAHGYTREILERDGELPSVVYDDFATYVDGLPIVSYNIKYDHAEVLGSEWRRLGIKPIGAPGFCALRLTQRLLDPVPAGNCKLQTLRQYYRLPERGTHTALGDVQTVADLLSNVLRPIAEQRGLNSWPDVCAYAKAEWFPSRIAFGKFKDRDFRDAHTDRAMRDWLTWLADSSNARNALMGRWYLNKLKQETGRADGGATLTIALGDGAGTQSSATAANQQAGLVSYANLEVERLQQLIASARARLAEIEATYTMDRCAVDATQAIIFKLVRKHYQARDNLRLVIEHREKYLNALLHDGEQEAEEVTGNYEKTRTQSDANYKEAEGAAAKRRELTSDEENELKTLWKKLVLLYHPDRFAHQPDKIETYQKLTGVINRAREEGNIDLLREIANDPHGFILRQGWTSLDFSDDLEIRTLHKLLATLQLEVVNMIESLNILHGTSEYELYKLSVKQPGVLQKVADEQINAIAAEIIELETEAERLKAEIVELTGADDPVWSIN